MFAHLWATLMGGLEELIPPEIHWSTWYCCCFSAICQYHHSLKGIRCQAICYHHNLYCCNNMCSRWAYSWIFGIPHWEEYQKHCFSYVVCTDICIRISNPSWWCTIWCTPRRCLLMHVNIDMLIPNTIKSLPFFLRASIPIAMPVMTCCIVPCDSSSVVLG